MVRFVPGNHPNNPDCKGGKVWTLGIGKFKNHSGWKWEKTDFCEGKSETFTTNGYNCCSQQEAVMRVSEAIRDWKESIRGKKGTANSKNSGGDGRKKEKDTELETLKKSQKSVVDQIQDIRKDIEKTIPEKAKDIEKIAQEVEAKNAERKKELDEAREKLEQEKVEMAAEIKRAREANNKQLEALAVAKMQEMDNKIGEILAEKKELIDSGEIKKLLQSYNDPWYKRINWKNPYTYGYAALYATITVTLLLLLVWIWKKIKTYFFNQK